MSSVSSSPVGALLHGLDRQYVYIAGTAIVVCAVVATVLLLSFGKQKIDYNSGIFSYLKFIYATTDGTLVADIAPLGSGAIPFRRMLALNKAAYDQVRSRAESWVPLSLENCSAIEPLFMACDFWGVRT